MTKVQVDSQHYRPTYYDSKVRFVSYWQQINLALESNPQKILEIGIGNGFVCDYLRKLKIDVVTIDIDENLKPDVVGSVLELPFEDNQFDCVICCEVLEHIPYDDFRKALSELHRVSKSSVILSLPDASKYCLFQLKIPKICNIKSVLPHLSLKKKKHKFDGQHYWEIGKQNYPLSKIINDIKESKLQITQNFRLPEEPFYRFFNLTK